MNETQTEHEQVIAGGLKPRAITVLGLLEHAECRTLNTRTLAKHMGERANALVDLLSEMRRLGLIVRANNQPEAPAARTWRLAIHTVRRRKVRS